MAKCEICGNDSQEYIYCEECFKKIENGETLKCSLCNKQYLKGTRCKCILKPTPIIKKTGNQGQEKTQNSTNTNETQKTAFYNQKNSQLSYLVIMYRYLIETNIYLVHILHQHYLPSQNQDFLDYKYMLFLSLFQSIPYFHQ